MNSLLERVLNMLRLAKLDPNVFGGGLASEGRKPTVFGTTSTIMQQFQNLGRFLKELKINVFGENYSPEYLEQGYTRATSALRDTKVLATEGNFLEILKLW